MSATDVATFGPAQRSRNPRTTFALTLSMQRSLHHQRTTVCAAQSESRKAVGPKQVRDPAVAVALRARADHVSRRKLQTPAAVAERVAVKLDEIDVLGSRTIPVGLLTAMAADGSLVFAPEQPEQHNMFFHSRKMASSLVVPVIQGKDTPPITLEASSSGCFRVLGGSPRVTSLLAFVTGSADVGGQHWPSAPVELDARDDAIRWHGKTFSQLPLDKKQEVYSYPVNCIIVKPTQAT